MLRICLLILGIILVVIGKQAFADCSNAVTSSNGYIRSLIPGQMNTAAFLTLSNPTNKPCTITHASSDFARFTELHRHIEDNGVMRMREVEQLVIPAKGQLVLEPGGLHVMFMGLEKNLKEQTSASLTFHFSDGSKKTIDLPIVNRLTQS